MPLNARIGKICSSRHNNKMRFLLGFSEYCLFFCCKMKMVESEGTKYDRAEVGLMTDDVRIAKDWKA